MFSQIAPPPPSPDPPSFNIQYSYRYMYYTSVILRCMNGLWCKNIFIVLECQLCIKPLWWETLRWCRCYWSVMLMSVSMTTKVRHQHLVDQWQFRDINISPHTIVISVPDGDCFWMEKNMWFLKKISPRKDLNCYSWVDDAISVHDL